MPLNLLRQHPRAKRACARPRIYEMPRLTLHYRWGDSEDVRIPVQLETTPTQFSGKRWWFICPLIVRGVACYRRVGKLYLPPGARHFGCRECHDLTYRSCQKAHAAERLCASMDRLKRWLGARKN